MSKQIVNRAAEIKRLHAEIGEAIRTSIDKALRIGQLLTAQKAETKHGDWLPWLKANVPFSFRSAQRFMDLWDNREYVGKSANVTHLRDAYELLSAERIKESYDSEIEWEKRRAANKAKQAKLDARAEGEIPEGWTEEDEKDWTDPENEDRKDRLWEKRDEAQGDPAEFMKRWNQSWSAEDERLYQEYERKRREWSREWDNSFGNLFGFTEDKWTLGGAEQDKDQEALFRALDKYFDGFSDDNRKLHAVHNCIKKLKEVALTCHVAIHNGGAPGVPEVDPELIRANVAGEFKLPVSEVRIRDIPIPDHVRVTPTYASRAAS